MCSALGFLFCVCAIAVHHTLAALILELHIDSNDFKQSIFCVLLIYLSQKAQRNKQQLGFPFFFLCNNSTLLRSSPYEL